ncbi:MAG: hypothetical protein LBC09_03310 [Helicobacteraceae bacterium]|jgi:hypothetical protein|nr:hypothetical protein [Helicobacteraceae bacterium]
MVRFTGLARFDKPPASLFALSPKSLSLLALTLCFKRTRRNNSGYIRNVILLSRWTAKYHIDFNGGSSNLHSCIGNNPINYVDPCDGLINKYLYWASNAYDSEFAYIIAEK